MTKVSLELGKYGSIVVELGFFIIGRSNYFWEFKKFLKYMFLIENKVVFEMVEEL